MTLILLLSFIAISCSTQKSIHSSPDDKKATLYYENGTSKLIKKDYTAALKNFLSAEKLREDDTKIQNNLGMAYWFKKQDRLAIQHLKRAIEIDEENSDARNNLASIYFQQKKYDLALLEYKTILKDLVYANQYRTYYNIALIFDKKQDQITMMENLEHSLKEKDDYCPAHFKIGQHYYNTRRYEKALESFHQSSLGVCTKSPGPFYWKAKSLAAQKRYFKAKREFKDLIKKFPRSSYARSAIQEITRIRKQELLSEKIREQNYRFRGNEKSLQSKKEELLDLETPDF